MNAAAGERCCCFGPESWWPARFVIERWRAWRYFDILRRAPGPDGGVAVSGRNKCLRSRGVSMDTIYSPQQIAARRYRHGAHRAVVLKSNGWAEEARVRSDGPSLDARDTGLETRNRGTGRGKAGWPRRRR